MATVATISVSSDIAPGFGGINESMTLTQGGNLIDIDSTTGFAIRKLSATGAAVLVDMSQELIETKDNSAAKIFIRNIGYKGVVDKSVGVTVLIASEPIGKLYGGDWMMMPLTGVDAGDVSINPATDDTVVIEYVMFFEEN
tara:strand:+ start:318 stop:740 length:423 start_codon:yes stop_codon:yes gene_type:complete